MTDDVQQSDEFRAAYLQGWYAGIASISPVTPNEDQLAAAVGHLSTELERARALLAEHGVEL